jgi:hypothetical protein
MKSITFTVYITVPFLQLIHYQRSNTLRRKEGREQFTGEFAGEEGRSRPPTRRGTMPTIDELVADVMNLPLPRRAPRLRSLLQHYVRHTLLYNYMASPDAAEEAFHLWNVVESPDR